MKINDFIKLINKTSSNLTEFDTLELQNYFFQEFWLTYQAKINQFFANQNTVSSKEVVADFFSKYFGNQQNSSSYHCR